MITYHERKDFSKASIYQISSIGPYRVHYDDVIIAPQTAVGDTSGPYPEAGENQGEDGEGDGGAEDGLRVAIHLVD